MAAELDVVADLATLVLDNKDQLVLRAKKAALAWSVLRPYCATLAGVDLSGAMLDLARDRKLYDSLEQCDLVEALRRGPQGFDLLTAADVLIYMGDLSLTFEAAPKALCGITNDSFGEGLSSSGRRPTTPQP